MKDCTVTQKWPYLLSITIQIIIFKNKKQLLRIRRILYFWGFQIQIRFLPSTQEGVKLNEINARVTEFY
jgi:hypothetical protein